MKVVTQLLGRVVLVTPTEEIIPRESVFLPGVVDAVAAKYHFTVKPNLALLSPEDISSKGLVFRLGKLMHDGKEAAISDFTIFEQVLTITARDTRAAQAFIHDVFNTLVEHYDFRRDPITDDRMLVLSELLVEFEDVFNNAIRGFDSISRRLQEAVKNQYHIDSRYGTTGVSFDFSREIVPQPIINVANFLIERRNSPPSSKNRYFARAPFHTDHHIQLLGEIETAFKR
jgi:hypothetical protein